VIVLSRGEKLYVAWVVAVVLLGVAVSAVILASGPPSVSTPIDGFPLATRTYLTTEAGDAFLTTDVVMPEDLDR
jgi:hypothetical protein